MQSLKDGVSFEEMTKFSDDKARLKTEVNYLGLDRSNGARVRKQPSTYHLLEIYLNLFKLCMVGT